MKRRSILKAMLGALVVPWKAIAEPNVAGFHVKPDAKLVEKGLAVDVYEGEFGLSIMDLPKVRDAQSGITDYYRGMVTEEQLQQACRDVFSDNYGKPTLVYPDGVMNVQARPQFGRTEDGLS